MAGKNAGVQLTKKDFKEPTAIIRLTKLFRPGLEYERFALYEATRAHWSAKKDGRIPKTKLALAVHEGEVIEVYRIAAWLPANSTMKYFRMDNAEGSRHEFVGEIAERRVRDMYLGALVSNLFAKGDVRPVACFGF